MIAIVIERAGEATRRKVFPRGLPIRIGSDPENELVLVHDNVADYHAYLDVEPAAVYATAASDEPLVVDGKRAKSRKRVKQSLRIGPYELRLVGASELPVVGAPDPVERELLRAIADRDEASRLVYADWLEHRGDLIRAEFLRLQLEIGALAADDARFEPATDRLRELAAHVDVGWRARVARPSIEGCDGFDFQCPKEWGSLAATDRPEVRFCGACKQQVFYSATVAEAREHAAAGECVALDISSMRWPDDLAAPFGEHVCPSCELDVGRSVYHCPACGTMVRRRQMLRGRMVLPPRPGDLDG